MRIKLGSKSVVAPVLALVAIVGLSAYVRSGNETEPRYFTAHVGRGDIMDEVQATGVINPVVTVQVGSRVSGTVARLNVDFNSHVVRGEVIALIDPALFEGVLQQAISDLEDAKANVIAAGANLDRARATLAQSEADYRRQSMLVQIGAVSKAVEETSKANLDVAKAGIVAGEAAVAQAMAQVRLKQASVTVARTNLEYCTIRSPIDGVVIARNVDAGQTVAASLQAPVIFTIAQDLTKMQLYAKTDESDEGRIRTGEQVEFRVDAFPGKTFRGVISQKRMNATTVQNVVTYDTVIDFENPDQKLFPGMTAYVAIPVAAAKDALKVPNTALRFRPSLDSAALRSIYQRYGIGDTRSAAAQSGAIIWKRLSGGRLEPVQIETGVTDHAFTEVVRIVKGELRPQDEIVTATADASS